MSLAVRLAAEAAIELEEAASWYESKRANLGESFVDAVEAAIGLVADWPGAGGRAPGVRPNLGARRAPVQGFPFHIAYLVTNDEVRLLAVAHDRRKPGYWASRA